ncbi:MAG: serpin family protein [Candidatus Neptunochlamydia sp.]|nr:serpin family protein [Candidatus Neptunochlamydia sp.]
MRLSPIRFLVLIGLLTAISPLKAQEDDNTLADSLNQTGMFLYYIMEKSSNTVISPFSITSSLLMAYVGAKGKTAQEMRRALHLTLPQDQVGVAYRNMWDRLGRDVKVGASIWVGKDTSILSHYETVVHEDFKGEIEKVDFTKPQLAASKIDDWISNNSEGKISRFTDPTTLDKSTKMILLNTFFIKGLWDSPFPTQRSGTSQFKTRSGQYVNCRMMNQKSSLYYFENKDTQIVALPIEGLNSHISFIIFLPKEEHSYLYDFYYSQDESKPKGFLSYLNQFEKKDLDLSLPKFIVSQKFDLNDLFRTLDIHSALNTNANFSGIDGKQDLYISQAFHESILSIDEGGVFAAAGSSITFSLKAFREPKNPIVMNVNRPFLYAIYDFDTNLLLFLGECQNPSAQSDMINGGENS